jgi:hypothetical protein
MMIEFMRKNARWIAGIILCAFLVSTFMMMGPFLGG